MSEKPEEPQPVVPQEEPPPPPPEYSPDQDLIDYFKKSGDQDEQEHR